MCLLLPFSPPCLTSCNKFAYDFLVVGRLHLLQEFFYGMEGERFVALDRRVLLKEGHGG